MCGLPPVTSYVESAAGVAAGARTGLSAIVVAALFLAAIFLSPLAGMIPSYATAGALIYVAFVMMSSMQHVDWKDFTNGAPAAITALMMPLTFSIANGIALGFITYTVLKVATGKTKDVFHFNVLAQRHFSSPSSCSLANQKSSGNFSL